MNTTCNNCDFGSCAVYALTPRELKEMGKETCQARFSRGEILRKQEAPVDTAIYLRSGYVKEYVSHRTAPDQVIQIIRPRSYIGLQSLCTHTSSAFSYQAIADTEVCYIRKETFSRLIRGNGDFAREILLCLSRESMSNHRRFLSLNQNQTYGKVAGLIIYLSEEVYENTRFELQLKRSELAQMVATTRESVTRALRWLNAEDVITMENNQLRINQFDRLKDIARRG